MNGHRCCFNTKGSSVVKKTLIIGAVVLAGLFIARKTHLCSYASTLWTQVRQEAKAQIPTKFELDRIRQEIVRMDGDIKGMASPIAEHMAAVSRLKKDIEKSRTTLTERKADIKTMVADLDKGGAFIVYGDRQFTLKQVQNQVERDAAACKRLESHLALQEKLLVAKEQALDATREQLNKLIAQRDEFKVRLAEAETREEQLRIAEIGSSVPSNYGRATELNESLTNLQQQQDVREKRLEVENGALAASNISPRATSSSTNLDEVRNWLHGPAAPAPNGGTKTAQK